MSIIRQYPINCTSCNVTGRISNIGTTTNIYRTCPACNGTGIVIMTETIPENITALNSFIDNSEEER